MMPLRAAVCWLARSLLRAFRPHLPAQSRSKPQYPRALWSRWDGRYCGCLSALTQSALKCGYVVACKGLFRDARVGSSREDYDEHRSGTTRASRRCSSSTSDAVLEVRGDSGGDSAHQRWLALVSVRPTKTRMNWRSLALAGASRGPDKREVFGSWLGSPRMHRPGADASVGGSRVRLSKAPESRTHLVQVVRSKL